MIACVPVELDGTVDPRWGRAPRVAVARVEAGSIVDWHEFDVRWDQAHETASEGGHHARIARFLIDNRVDTVVADHMGEGMLRMLPRMGVRIRLGASGDARAAVEAVAAEATSGRPAERLSG